MLPTFMLFENRIDREKNQSNVSLVFIETFLSEN